jgi:predicted enzyme related to lactoylglutathione lyase
MKQVKQIIGPVIWVGVNVKDYEAQKQFYGDLLGLKVQLSDDSHTIYEVKGATVLELKVISAEQPQNRKKGFQPGYQVVDIEAARAELVARGARPVGEIHTSKTGSSKWCYFKDGEGNIFLLSQRNT